MSKNERSKNKKGSGSLIGASGVRVSGSAVLWWR